MQRSTPTAARRCRALAPLAAAVLAAGCFSSPGPPPPVRYFEPARAEAAPAGRTAEPLRLSVGARAEVRELMVWRLSEVEVAFDEENRWAASPAGFAEEALVDALFVRGAFHPQDGGRAHGLDVEVQTFEGALSDRPAARVVLVARFAPRSGEPAVGRFEATVPVAARKAPELAQGMGAALARATGELVGWVDGLLAVAAAEGAAE